MGDDLGHGSELLGLVGLWVGGDGAQQHEVGRQRLFPGGAKGVVKAVVPWAGPKDDLDSKVLTLRLDFSRS